jgi:uncharacterized protein (DUF4415 family)
MPTNTKPKTTLPPFSPECIAAALEAAPDVAEEEDQVDWSRAVVTPGGGVDATLAALRRARGPGQKPRKTQLTVRYSPEVVAYFKATGKGWQARMDAALKEWIAQHSG